MTTSPYGISKSRVVVAMRDECLDGLLALAEQQGQLTGLPQIIESRPGLAVSCFVLLMPLADVRYAAESSPTRGRREGQRWAISGSAHV
ncbi:hypothetical protein [Bradyrhizobium sp. 15]|uniref:hypothetical protein n=1 Tax=Bradyrhizobium sp. 15 TaxID=2782633 RepID=UPI001FFC0763|nr:hypothetical protein [Bradyrhizobium sp. 15]MCK1439902.1 hypothetical protein [Bradyrhizobium sp. 15]